MAVEKVNVLDLLSGVQKFFMTIINELRNPTLGLPTDFSLPPQFSVTKTTQRRRNAFGSESFNVDG
jgi:hypothetical protein